MTIVEDTTAAEAKPQKPKVKIAAKSQAVAVAAPLAPPAPPSGSLAVLQQARRTAPPAMT
jgi:hypothetical protein